MYVPFAITKSSVEEKNTVPLIPCGIGCHIQRPFMPFTTTLSACHLILLPLLVMQI